MKRFVVLAAAALGTTTIWNIKIAQPLISQEHTAVYHWSAGVSSLFLPVFLDICIPWFLLTLLLVVVQRPGRLRVAVWFAIVLSLALIGLKGLADWKRWNFPSGVMPLAAVGIFIVAILWIAAYWRSDFEPRFDRVQNFVATMLCFGALSGILVFSELAWFAWQARALNTNLPLHSAQSAPPELQAGRPRIIWILFDELSYEQIYERPAKGLKLPAFNQVATESTVFTHVVPAGILTELVMPSLMMGEPLDMVRFSGSGQLSTRNPAGVWQKFDPHATVFQDALSAGYKTAVAGWYNPYCRILPQVLDRCFWRSGEANEGDMFPYDSVQTNMVRLYLTSFPGLTKLANRLGVIPVWSDHLAELHASDYSELFTEADRVIEDRTNNFILIHMPIPHPPGIYNRTEGVLAVRGSSYLDNLVLADKYLAHIRSLLEKEGQWDSSAVLIMGDHSWRTKLFWSHRPDWTKEEQVASQGGRFDDRPAYIVKLPNQHKGNRIDAPYAAVNTRKLIDALMSNSIGSPEALSSWVAETRAKP